MTRGTRDADRPDDAPQPGQRMPHRLSASRRDGNLDGGDGAERRPRRVLGLRRPRRRQRVPARRSTGSSSTKRHSRNCVTRCSIVVSICPPHAAGDVAEQVDRVRIRWRSTSTRTPISPARTVKRSARQVTAAGIDFVDGGVIGNPARERNTTWLHLAGPCAEEVAQLLRGGPSRSGDDGPGDRPRFGDQDVLRREHERNDGSPERDSPPPRKASACGRNSKRSGTRYEDGVSRERTRARVVRNTAKAWRFEGEMHEIAATFEGAGVPGGFHQSGERNLPSHRARYKDAAELPDFTAVLRALIESAEVRRPGGRLMDETFTRYVIMLRTGAPDVDWQESVVREHVAWLQKLDREGKLEMAGPFEDGRGGMVIVRAANREDAEDDRAAPIRFIRTATRTSKCGRGCSRARRTGTWEWPNERTETRTNERGEPDGRVPTARRSDPALSGGARVSNGEGASGRAFRLRRDSRRGHGVRTPQKIVKHM